MKKISKLLVIIAAASAMIFVGCANASSGGGGGSSGGGGGYTPKISSEEEVSVLGTYTSGGETLTFNDDLTGNYDDGTSGNSRAITKGAFTWTITAGTDTIIIRQGDNSETATLSTSGNSNKIQFNGKYFGFKAPTADDIVGKTGTLIYPSTSELDRKLTNSGAWYPIKLKYNAGGTGSSTVRANTGSRVEQLDKTGYWRIVGDYIFLYDDDSYAYGRAKCKISGNRSSAWTDFGLLVYQIQ